MNLFLLVFSVSRYFGGFSSAMAMNDLRIKNNPRRVRIGMEKTTFRLGKTVIFSPSGNERAGEKKSRCNTISR
ncbi:MAG TPA: hypothetical protein VMD74_00250 [Candidatus Methylomirabilis sp.]|nr:hypothetical protein [Candidatus Methylomirabilis sp.]